MIYTYSTEKAYTKVKSSIETENATPMAIGSFHVKSPNG